jgi:peptidase E
MVLPKGTFLTLGGGGFSMSDDGSSLIDDFLLALTGKELPRVCFVPTASGDAENYIERFEAAFAGRAQTSVLSLFGRDGDELRSPTLNRPSMVLEQDVVYVGGGSTANLLAIWRLHGLDTLLAQAAMNGTILAGVSAGMNCWHQSSSTDSFGPLAPLRDGLGFLPGSVCPHYFGEEDRQAAYVSWVADGSLEGGYAADDNVALLWRDGELIEAISERAGAQAFHVARVGDHAIETPLPVRLLQ